MASASKEIVRVNKTVEKLLIAHPALRDDDKKLCATVWLNQVGGLEALKTMDAYEFFQKYVASQTVLFKGDSITRAARLLRAENPALRGKFYKQRKNESKAVKKALGYKVD